MKMLQENVNPYTQHILVGPITLQCSLWNLTRLHLGRWDAARYIERTKNKLFFLIIIFMWFSLLLLLLLFSIPITYGWLLGMYLSNNTYNIHLLVFFFLVWLLLVISYARTIYFTAHCILCQSDIFRCAVYFTFCIFKWNGP